MKNQLLFVISLIFSSFISPIKISKPIPRTSIAIRRLKERVQFLDDDTSCKVAAKFILLAICNINKKEELPILALTSDYKKDLESIKEKLLKGYVLHIEIKSNHHFIIFKKNNKELFLLQAFQDRLQLIDWINNDKIMKPYLTIKVFFEKMETMLNPDTPRAAFEQTIIDLFLPPIFSTDEALIKKTVSYFLGNSARLINVNYVPFDFSNRSKGENFDKLFNYVDTHYHIY